MRENAGERLFEIIGRIPEEIVLEAHQDHLQGDLNPNEERPDSIQNILEEEGQNVTEDLPGDEKIQGPIQDQGQYETHGSSLENDILRQSGPDKEIKTGRDMTEGDKLPKKGAKKGIFRLGDHFKYLPAAVCLCLVIGSVYYIVNSYYPSNLKEDFSMSGGSEETARDTAWNNENAKAQQEAGNGSDDSGNPDTVESAQLQLPLRFDAYEGPVIAMTATGDTQGITTTRNLKCKAVQEKGRQTDQPLLYVDDVYHIKNTSKDDKTLQLVYPFAATLNLAYHPKEEILKVHGQEYPMVQYGIGDSIFAYRQQAEGTTGTAESSVDDKGQKAAWTSTMEDYQQLFAHDSSYLKSALEKEADWEREVSVYTFTDVRVEEEGILGNSPAVIGVTVYGSDAEVLTCGFSHSFESEQGVGNHCFFVSDNQSRIMLIVTGQQDREPALGYYSNLDCEETVEGVQCTVQKQTMSYSDALKLCTGAIAKQTVQNYEQDVYAGELPEYFDAAAVYQALTMGSSEEEFYDTLVQRYQSTELRDICERIFGETRIIYAMTTVTIPGKKTLKVTACTQKRQSSVYFTLLEKPDETEEETYQYDFLSGRKSLLNITQTMFRLSMPEKWQAAESSLKLKHTRSIWKTKWKEESFQVTVTPCFELETLVN